MTATGQDAVVAFLADPASHGTTDKVEVIGTHISKVFLAGHRAYKLKRAVKLPYTDGSTAELRYATCLKEFELNSPHAPGLYLGVRKITRMPDSKLAFDGDGPMVDAVVEMVRFDQAAMFDQMAERGALTAGLMTDLAAIIAEFHVAAPVVHAGSGSANVAGVLDINLAGFHTSDVFSEAEITGLDTAFRAQLERHRAHFDAREEAGLVRRCHGDLHLRNICLFERRPTLFDCIEFSDQLATVDVLYDLAFLLMDLWHRGLPGFANLAANRYFDETGADSAFELLPFFMALRAQVRAHVTATFAMSAGAEAPGQIEIARSYYDLAFALLADTTPHMVAIGGVSGSGKTTLAEALAPSVGAAPGARLLESDRIRKVLFGVASDTRLPAAAYRPEISDAVYASLATRARALADAGASVVVNAVYDRADRRDALEEALASHPFTGIWLTADPDILRARVHARPKGASDATVEVLDAQLRRDPGDISWHNVTSAGHVEATVASVLALISVADPAPPA